ncbi:MAG: hypothetical protein M3P27_02840 [Acidobacteriota bacterium]|nr:hypothetical protein [Acidobacteriota bacterium]
MNHVTNIIGDPYFWGLVFAYWTFSSAVGALVSPKPTSSDFYRWAFTFLNTLAGNISRAFASKIPGADSVVPPVQAAMANVDRAIANLGAAQEVAVDAATTAAKSEAQAKKDAAAAEAKNGDSK